MMKRVLSTFALSLVSITFVFAQGREVKLPLESNPILSNYAQQQDEVQVQKKYKEPFGKVAISGGFFPFIDHFSSPSLDSLWLSGNATKSGHSAVLNALDVNNAPYGGGTGSFGPCDELTSDTINIGKSAGGNRLYMMFVYSTGSSWNTGDSLILQFKTGSGVYRTIWRSSNVSVANAEIILSPIDNIDDYIGVGFNFRFVNYSSQTSANTQDYVIHSVMLADKWALPAYENFLAYDTLNNTPTSTMWAQKTTYRWEGTNANMYIPNVNVAVFDAMDEYGVVYNGANGSVGYGDTMMSHPMDMLQFANTDSVYLRFYYRAMPNVKLTDSLFLECRQNTGVWTRVWQTGGAAQSDFGTYINQVNFGRLRHANFQFRFVSKCAYTASDTLKFVIAGAHVGKKLQLPLFDDFSRSTMYPDQKIWLNKQVYINNHFPIKPPSINVATFDGLDFRGNPYGTALVGNCDTLTSYPFKLSGLTRGDSVYLSFWVEPQGLGYNDHVNIQSELTVEVRSYPTDPNTYETIWSAKMPSLPSDTFKQISILIDSMYLHDDLQIRIRNVGSQTGNLDHWHVDYIRLDKGRKAFDSYFDVAMNSNPGSLLTPYSSMPRNHFLSNPSSFIKTQQKVGAKNNHFQAVPIAYCRAVYAPDYNRVDTFGDLNPNFPPLSDTTLTIPTAPNISGTYPGDSMNFRTKYYTTLTNTTDNVFFNDTFSVNTLFSNFFAYDDGSAENGYAIEKTTGAVALAYTLAQPDTLYGMSIFFNRSVTDVSQKTFDLLVYNSINTSGADADILLRVPSFTPVYTNKINGFYYYQLAVPLGLPAGTFYIGWEQHQQFSLNVGLDENFQVDGEHVPNPNMYVRLDNVGVWQQTQLTGALMMRPLVGKWLAPPVGVAEISNGQKQSALQVEVYPNPASNIVYLNSKENAVFSVELVDLSGRLIMSRKGISNQLSLPSCVDGMYFLKVTDAKGNSAVKKILIQHY